MEPETLEENILKYGNFNDITSLQRILSNTTDTELVNLIEHRINSKNYSTLWNHIIQGLSETSTNRKRRLNIIMELLKKIPNSDRLLSSVRFLIQQINMDLICFESEHLVALCDFCLVLIQTGNREQNIWKDILPNILQILSERNMVIFNDREYNGQDFKTNFINTLCTINWSLDIIVYISVMFIDTPLTKDEHMKVVAKLTNYIEKVDSQTLPPFIYQLLTLCRHSYARMLFSKLLYYFDVNIYTKDFSQQDDIQMQDTIENADDIDMLHAESMVLYYIQNAASIGHKCIKDYLTSLKNCNKSPEFILHPFQILVLFAIATVHQYEGTCFDIIRQSIVNCYNEEIRKKKSIWYRDLINVAIDIEKVFSQVINLGERESILEPLINFGYSLLNVGASLGRDILAEKQWNLGKIILLKVIKKKRHTASEIIKTFCNHIITKQHAPQYIECLHILTRTMPLLVLDNQSSVTELLDSLIQSTGLSGNNSDQLLDTLLPLIKVSPAIQDQFILVLRKALYSRSIDIRKMAVNGFTKLISILKITNKNMILSDGSSSGQSFHSGYSLYTQISLSGSQCSLGSNRFSNEALFLEILNILKRCFTQQAAVRTILYKNLCKVAYINHELGLPILDMTWFQLIEYYVMDEEIISPINIEKIIDLNEKGCTLIEPLGQFFFSIAMIVLQINNQSEENSDHATVLKYMKILDSISNRMAKCELTDFGLDDSVDLLSASPESQQKSQILKEIILICEALIGYKIVLWTNQNREQGTKINQLFESYSQFVYFGKNVKKAKKSISSKKTQSNTQTANISNDVDTTISRNAMSAPKPSFQVPSTLLNFHVVERALKILLEPTVPWLSSEETDIIKSNINLHIYFLEAANSLINQCKNQKMIGMHYNKNDLEYISSIGETIYSTVILKFTDYLKFDSAAALAALECFHMILLLINKQLESNLINFLSRITQKNKNLEMVEYLDPIIDTLQNILENNLNKNSEMEKRVSILLISNLNGLYGLIPAGSNSLLEKSYDWLKNIAYSNTISNKVSGIFMDLLFPSHLKSKIGLSIFENVSNSINKLMATTNESIEETADSLNIISLATVNPIILSLCTNMKIVLEEIDHVIGRMKCDYYIISYPGMKEREKKLEDLKSKDKGVCMQLCFVLNILSDLASILAPPGNISDAIFKCLLQFYTSMSTLTKYFISRSSKNVIPFHGSWFEKLIKKTGKQLTPLVYTFISHIGESVNNDCDQDDSTQRKVTKRKKPSAASMKNKILKETKILPKVIYEIEQLSRFIIQLTKKTSVDLFKYVGTGIVRDFRIVQLKETLEQAGSTNTGLECDSSSDEYESNEETNNVSTEVPPTKKLKC